MFPTAPNGAPTNIRLTDSTDTSLEISWDEPLCEERNGPIQYYTYEFQLLNQVIQRGISTTNTWTREHLQCDTVYLFQIAAVTEVGEGPTSSQMRFKTDYSAGI